MEKLNLLMRSTLATQSANEVCFTYVPNSRVDKNIFALRYGSSEIEGDGVTYSFDRETMNRCFHKKTPVISTAVWTLSVPPFASRTIHSVITPSDSPHAMHDEVLAAYAQEQAASAVGMMVVHFFSEGEADVFKRRLADM
jgi:hypothetical protein